MGLAAEIRHNKILDKLCSAGRIYVSDLSHTLGVTKVTIRQDLVVLQSSGMLKKTHGGAFLVAPVLNVSGRYHRLRRLAAKRIIEKLASDLVKDGDIIYLEAGSDLL